MTAPPNRHRTGTRVLLGIAFATCALLLGFASGCSPAQHYQKHHDMKSLYATLKVQVKKGDSLKHVQEILGPGITLSGQARQEAASRYVQFTQRDPRIFPDGVQGDDLFLGYVAENLVVALQFRNGRLINFDPKQYETLPQIPGKSP